MLARSFAPGEAARRCACGRVTVAKVGDVCPARGCHRMFPSLPAIHDALVTACRRGEERVVAPALGVEGRCVTDGRRVFGVVA